MSSDQTALSKLRQLHQQHSANLGIGIARVRIEDWRRATTLDGDAFARAIERLERRGLINREFGYARPA